MNSATLCLLTLVGAVQAADPSGGWLSYAVYTAPNPTDIITRMGATMVVPETPKSKNGSPGTFPVTYSVWQPF